MASTTAVRAPALRPVRAPKKVAPALHPKPRLTVLAAPRTARSPLPFTLLCTLIVAATLATVLYLNIQMSDTSYEITRLQAQSQRLTEEKQALAETNEQLGTPQELERRASELGMVPVTETAYIDLASGTVMGETSPDEQTASHPELAEQPAAVVVPPAQIYDEPTSYHGMGNEGA